MIQLTEKQLMQSLSHNVFPDTNILVEGDISEELVKSIPPDRRNYVKKLQDSHGKVVYIIGTDDPYDKYFFDHIESGNIEYDSGYFISRDPSFTRMTDKMYEKTIFIDIIGDDPESIIRPNPERHEYRSPLPGKTPVSKSTLHPNDFPYFS